MRLIDADALDHAFLLLGYEEKGLPRRMLGHMPTEDKVQAESCDGCAWRNKRHQKCSCCRRNRHMKDNYFAESFH